MTPTLALPPGVDLAAYSARWSQRFGNPALPHRTQQIAMDGSQKLPQRLLGTVRDNLAAGRPMRICRARRRRLDALRAGVDEAGQRDRGLRPARGAISRAIAAATRAATRAALARRLARPAAVFGDDLPRDRAFRVPRSPHGSPRCTPTARAATVARARSARAPKHD